MRVHQVRLSSQNMHGVVEYVSSEKIVVRVDESAFKNTDDWISQGVDTYYLRKFQRSSYYTWIHQSPIVKPGDRGQSGGHFE